MPLLNDWIDSKLAEIANKLPGLVHSSPSSFSCGHAMGYKQALLDLENFMNDIENFPEGFNTIYQDRMELMMF